MFTIGVAVSENQIKAVAYDESYKAVASCSCVCNKESFASDISALISELNVDKNSINGIGISIPESLACPDKLAKDVEAITKVNTKGTATINARALGEAYIRDDQPYFVLLSIGDTAESGVIIDKKLYTGIGSFGGRVAHMVINYGGYDCRCGCKGCFEAYASSSGVKRIAKDAGVASADTITLAELFAVSTPEAEKAKESYIAYLSSGITDVINLFQPNVLALEGEFYDIGSAILGPMTEIVLRDQYSSSMDNKCKMTEAMPEAQSAVLGAALLFR